MRQNLTVFEGETWSFVFVYRDASGIVDLTGYSARMAVRRFISGGLRVYLSTGSDAAGGTLALGGTSGTIAMAMTDLETSAIMVNNDLDDIIHGIKRRMDEQFIYDLEVVAPSGDVSRPISGDLLLIRSVT